MTIEREPFGLTPDGQPVERYMLSSPSGVRAQVITYGGTLQSLHAPDRHGRPGEITLGFDTLDGYLGNHPYIGALVGRFANRIAGGRFTLDGAEVQLPINDSPNSLHGGTIGFGRRVWTAEAGTQHGQPALQLTYGSSAGEDGYPGLLNVTAVYVLTDDGDVRIEFGAVCDQPTIANLTHHAYFNLAGQGDILAHQVQLNADHFLPVDAALIPTGELRDVTGTPMDLRELTELRGRIAEPDAQLQGVGNGFDHCFVLSGEADEDGLKHAAHLLDPHSGRTLDVLTTQPGLQLYTGNMLTGSVTGRGGWRYVKHSALCLETQHFPDSPNHPHFPSTVLRPGDMLHQVTVYRPGTD